MLRMCEKMVNASDQKETAGWLDDADAVTSKAPYLPERVACAMTAALKNNRASADHHGKRTIVVPPPIHHDRLR